jgi:hypothetical protein
VCDLLLFVHFIGVPTGFLHFRLPVAPLPENCLASREVAVCSHRGVFKNEGPAPLSFIRQRPAQSSSPNAIVGVASCDVESQQLPLRQYMGDCLCMLEHYLRRTPDILRVPEYMVSTRHTLDQVCITSMGSTPVYGAVCSIDGINCVLQCNGEYSAYMGGTPVYEDPEIVDSRCVDFLARKWLVWVGMCLGGMVQSGTLMQTLSVYRPVSQTSTHSWKKYQTVDLSFQ